MLTEQWDEPYIDFGLSSTASFGPCLSGASGGWRAPDLGGEAEDVRDRAEHAEQMECERARQEEDRQARAEAEQAMRDRLEGREGQKERERVMQEDEETQHNSCESLSQYQVRGKLGEGTFGKVYKAWDPRTRLNYALKKIHIDWDHEGVPGPVMREISLLRQVKHNNVIRLHQVITTREHLYLVFEFLDMDLWNYLKVHGPIRDPVLLRRGALQCFSALNHCHCRAILHRDLKPQNVLIDMAAQRMKLADFGLSRMFSVPVRPYTHEVVTLWYRAIEILLGQTKYLWTVDIWSLGCILAEMATSSVLFRGDSEIDTIFRIFRLLGTPSEEVWPGVSKLPHMKARFPQWSDTGLQCVEGEGLGEEGLDLIRICLRYNPVERISTQRLLHVQTLHPFFTGIDPDGPIHAP